MTTKEHSGQPRGRPILQEAAQLLGQLRFSERRGAYAEGRRVAVSVDPRWNADQTTLSVLITCFPLGHQHAAWAALPVHIRPDEGADGISAVARLDARGQARIPRLPPGDYRLSLRLAPARSAPVFSQRLDRLAAHEAGASEEERRVWRGASEDGAVLWTLEETEDGEVQIAFETSDARFAEQVVDFQLVDPASGQVRYSQQVTLTPTRTPGRWEGWQALGFQADFQDPYELVFAVLPPDGGA